MREAKILTFGCVAACRRAVGDEGRDVVRWSKRAKLWKCGSVCGGRRKKIMRRRGKDELGGKGGEFRGGAL